MNLGRNVLLGGFLLLCLLGLTIVSLFLYGMSFTPRTEWFTYFGGNVVIQEGFEVWSGGKKVGVVDTLAPVPDQEFRKDRQVRASVMIHEDVTIWKDGALVIRPRGFLGGFRVMLDRGTPQAGVLSSSQPLPARVDGGITQQLTDLVKENRKGLNRITSDLAEVTGSMRRGEGSLGAFLQDEKLFRDTAKAASNLVEFTEMLTSAEGSVGKILRDPELYDDLKRGIRSVANIAEKIDSDEGTLGGLLNDRTLLNRFSEGVRKFTDLATDLQSGRGALGMLLKDQETADNLAKTIRAARVFSERLTEGEGVIPELLNDSTIVADIRAATATVRAIAEDVHAGKGTLGKFLKNEGIYNELQRMLESFRESGDIARENAALGSLTSFAQLFFNSFN